MNQTMSNPMNQLKFSVVFLLSFILFSCSNNNKTSQEKRKLADDFNQQKEELKESLNQAKMNLNEALDQIEDEFNIKEGPIERKMENAKEELIAQRDDIEQALLKVDRATEKEWANLKAEIDQTYQVAVSKLKETQKKIDQAFDNIGKKKETSDS